jgi:hypothetical protein
MPTLSKDAQAQLDQLLEAYPSDLPGTVIGVVGKTGDLLYLSSTGPRSCGRSTRARPDDVSLPAIYPPHIRCSRFSRVPRWSQV